MVYKLVSRLPIIFSYYYDTMYVCIYEHIYSVCALEEFPIENPFFCKLDGTTSYNK